MRETRSTPWLVLATLTLAVLGVYTNALHGAFFFDDIPSIVESPNLRSLWPLSESMNAPGGSGASGRPLVALSLALNYALGELNVFGYHLFNVVVHLLCTLALFGVVRRTLLHGSPEAPATGLAFVCALLWGLHPLNTDAVNLVITRNEQMAAAGMLLCLYSMLRSIDAAKPQAWTLLAIVAAAAAMLSKEIAVSLPLLVLAYDRTFITGTFTQAWKARRPLYVGLMATWVLLVAAVLSGDRGASVGFGQELSSLDYLRTQASGILHYLRLSFWPSPLAVDYAGWPQVKEWGPAILPGSLVITLLGAATIASLRGARAGWLALAFFAILAPSSSFIPLAGEWLAEHRMYLPLTCVVCGVVLGTYQLLEKLRLNTKPAALLGIGFLCAALLGWKTVERNGDYISDRSIWEDCIVKYPNNGRAHDHLGAIYLGRREYQRALEYSMEAMRLDPSLYTVEFNIGAILLQLQRAEEALPYFAGAEEHLAGSARFHATYGIALSQAGKGGLALEQLKQAVDLVPSDPVTQRNLGYLYLDEERSQEGLQHLGLSLALEQDTAALMRMIRVFATDPNPRVRNGQQALQLVRQLIQSGPPDPRWFELLGLAHLELGQTKEALAALHKGLEGARHLKQTDLVQSLQVRLQALEQE
jgi:tetratricopeptide (TPR) repeat protein